MSAKQGVVEIDGQSLGILPLLTVSEPGHIRFEVTSKDGQKENIVKEIKSDFID